ncbi:MAG: UbiA family prenyltransferase [Planctomycetota bacterium]
MRGLLLRLAYANVTIAASATGLAAAAVLLAGHVPGAAALVLPFLSMFAVYTFDKVLGYDPVSDPVNDPERSAFVERWRRPLLALAGLGILGGTGWALSFGVAAAVLLWVPLLVGVLYGQRVLPEGFRYRRLKDVTGVKNLSVALTWAACCVTLPWVVEGLALDRVHWALWAWAAAHIFLNTAFFDLGDIQGDREEGVQTLPVVLGYAATRRLLLATALLAAALFAAGIWALDLPRAGSVCAGGMLVYELSYVLYARDEEQEIGFLCDVIVDSFGVVAAALALPVLLPR